MMSYCWFVYCQNQSEQLLDKTTLMWLYILVTWTKWLPCPCLISKNFLKTYGKGQWNWVLVWYIWHVGPTILFSNDDPRLTLTSLSPPGSIFQILTCLIWALWVHVTYLFTDNIIKSCDLPEWSIPTCYQSASSASPSSPAKVSSYLPFDKPFASRPSKFIISAD